MLQVAAVAEKHDLVVISDEIYERLVYGADHISISLLCQIWLNEPSCLSGMSKSYAMTGWRIGYVTAPAPFTEAMYKIHQYLIMVRTDHRASGVAAGDSFRRRRCRVDAAGI